MVTMPATIPHCCARDGRCPFGGGFAALSALRFLPHHFRVLALWLFSPFDRPSSSVASGAKTGISKRMAVQVSTLMVWLLCLALPAAARATDGNFREWNVYGGDAAGTKYSALDQINRTNVHGLRPVWIYHCDDMRLEPASTIECNPIIVDGMMFLTTAGLKVVALDAATGRARWVFDPGTAKADGCQSRSHLLVERRGPAHIFCGGNHLCALNAANGQLISTFGSDAGWTCATDSIGTCFI